MAKTVLSTPIRKQMKVQSSTKLHIFAGEVIIIIMIIIIIIIIIIIVI